MSNCECGGIDFGEALIGWMDGKNPEKQDEKRKKNDKNKMVFSNFAYTICPLCVHVNMRLCVPCCNDYSSCANFSPFPFVHITHV